MAKSSLHIIELRIANVKRIRAVTIRPDGSLVIVGGRNAQGKTSVLDAVEMALGGGKTLPAEPLRRGARKGGVVVDLGEYVVERTFTAKGSALVVTGKDGQPVKSPQAVLDALCSTVAFDPLAFSRMEPKKQDEVLKRLLGLDFTELERDRAELYAARTQLNRDLKQLDARMGAMPAPAAGLPAREVSVTELVAELDQRRETIAANERQRDAVADLENTAADLDGKARQVEERIAELKRDLAVAENELSTLADKRALKAREISDARAEAEQLVDPDLEDVKRQIATAEQTNAKVRQNAERAKLEGEARAVADKAEQLSDAITAIDEKKAEAIAGANFPVPGLGFDATGPTLNGLPLEQASGAEKLRVSVAIGAALNPRVRVMLVRDGSLLDQESLALLAELARAQDCQVLLERVGSADDGAVIIEDGMVREDAPAQGAAE
jgi:predicted  nucleic acid-binding Zn-ribbon protein